MVLDNDLDVDGTDTLSIHSINTTGTRGNVSNNSGDSITFYPYYGFLTVIQTFSYTVSDGNGPNRLLSETAIVLVTVTPVNDAPVIDVSNYSLQCNIRIRLLSFNVTATDVDGVDVLLYSLSGTAPAGATINELTGQFSWTPTVSHM